MDKITDAKIDEKVKDPQKPKPVKADLLSVVKESKGEFNLQDFKASVIGLFSDILKQEGHGLSDDVKGKLARLRARIEIELRDL